MADPLPLPEAQRGPAERLLDLVLSSSEHLWHHRPGVEVAGVWQPRRGTRARGTPVKPGLHAPAAVRLYGRLLEVYQLNAQLMAHFASWAFLQSEWRDLKVACAALMLVQTRSGQPVRGDGGAVEFHDDDLRAVGEAMVLKWERKSTQTLTPKAVLRVAELLEHADIAALNRRAGFGDPASKKAPLGRWKSAATKWLSLRERNPTMLQGLVKAGYKETLKKLARKAGYQPASPDFFAALGWKQKQAAGGHRTVGLGALKLTKSERFDGLTEAEICETIEGQRLGFKEVVGRLPKDLGLTPAIMVALLPSLSDRDLRQLTPTLEALGLMADPEVRARWEKALTTATDQRALNVAKNVKSGALKAKLEEAADHATRAAVKAAAKDQDLVVVFLVDKSGSMQGAIEQSQEALSRLLGGFPLEKLHVAAFDTSGFVLRPKTSSRAAVVHMLSVINAGGGTTHGAGVQALHHAGLRVAAGQSLVVMVAGDEAGETGQALADTFRQLGLPVAAMALLLSVAPGAARGRTVRDCAAVLRVPFSEVAVATFDDPYQVTRTLQALLEAPVPKSGGLGSSGWVDKVLKTPLLAVG